MGEAALCRTPEFQAIQLEAAGRIYEHAARNAADLGLETQLGLALVYDIRVQNGSLTRSVRDRALAAHESLPDEPAYREFIANARADLSNPRWREDVRARKLCVARGRGTVHGRHFDLARDFELGEDAWRG